MFNMYGRYLLQGAGLGEVGRQTNGVHQGSLDNAQVLQHSTIRPADENTLLLLLLLLLLVLVLLLLLNIR